MQEKMISDAIGREIFAVQFKNYSKLKIMV